MKALNIQIIETQSGERLRLILLKKTYLCFVSSKYKTDDRWVGWTGVLRDYCILVWTLKRT